ncbi:MAG: DnaA N-terminal domain-containing protein, partial [Acidimicrobiia bacterium]|nr:DnaA N-terminal domain-containing protein [Acidimicrobiia bacterium]
MDEFLHTIRSTLLSDADDLWTQVTLSLRSQLAESVWFSTFQDVVPVEGDADTLRLIAPSTYVRDRIQTRYLTLVTVALEDANEGHRRVEIDVTTDTPVTAGPDSIDSPTRTDPTARLNATHDDAPEQVGFETRVANIAADRSNGITEAGLNPRYTFETFVKGASNQLSERPGERVGHADGQSIPSQVGRSAIESSSVTSSSWSSTRSRS